MDINRCLASISNFLEVVRSWLTKMGIIFGNPNNPFKKTVKGAISFEVVSETKVQTTVKENSFNAKDQSQSYRSLYPTRFLAYFDATIEFEGNSRYEVVKGDLGGPTSYGISSSGNPDLAREIMVNKGLTKSRAYEVAYERYYSVIPYIASVNEKLGFVIFDSRFVGHKTNFMIMQQYLTELGLYSGLVDGIFGEKSMRACLGLSAVQVDHILYILKDKAREMAAVTMKRVRKEQLKSGLELTDFTDGWESRQKKRVAYALELRGV